LEATLIKRVDKHIKLSQETALRGMYCRVVGLKTAERLNEMKKNER